MARVLLCSVLTLVLVGGGGCDRGERGPAPDRAEETVEVRASAEAVRRYDASAVESLDGVVARVERTRTGVHLLLDTEAGPITALLGPAWFVDEQDLAITEGDRVVLTGAFVDRDGVRVLLVAELSKGGETMLLRDPDGRPLWRRRARARRDRVGQRSHRAARPWRSRQEVYAGSEIDVKALETVHGEVVAVELYRGEGLAGIYLKLKTEEGEIIVELGPAWYVGMQEPPIEEGDRVVVIGSRSRPSEMVAMRVRRDGHELWLRDPSGAPLWHGWRERGPTGEAVEEP